MKSLSEQPRATYSARAHYQDPHVAEVYDQVRFRSPLGRLRAALDRHALHRCLDSVPAGATILDVACGTGRITEVIRQRGFDAVGTDVSAAMLQVAGRRLERAGVPAPLVLADAVRLPFGRSAFRAATAVRFLGNLPRPVRIDVLRALGEVADLVIVDHTVRSAVGDLRRRAFREGWYRGGNPWAVVTERELRAELREASLDERRRVSLLPVLSDAVYLILERR